MKIRAYFASIKKKEESLIYDLEGDFKNNQVRFIIRLLSEFGSSFISFGIFVLLGLVLGFNAFALLCLVYGFQLVMTEIIKKVFNRKRPSTFKSEGLFGYKIIPMSGSFPSGHTSNAFSTALLLSTLFKTNLLFTSIFFIFAGLVGMSRMFLGKHYIVDVVGGAIIGMILTIVGMQIYILAYSKIFI